PITLIIISNHTGMTHLSPELNSARAVLVPAESDDQTRPIAWLTIACGRRPFAPCRPLHNEKPRLHSKMQTGSFMLSPLARLLHLREKRRGRRLRSCRSLKFCWCNSLVVPCDIFHRR